MVCTKWTTHSSPQRNATVVRRGGSTGAMSRTSSALTSPTVSQSRHRRIREGARVPNEGEARVRGHARRARPLQ